MREIAYFMLETRAGEAPSIRLGSRALRWETPRLERFLWHGYRVSLYLFPCRLEGTKRLHWWMERIGSALEEQGTMLWLAPELEAAWEDALRGRAGSLKVTVDRSSGGRTETIQSTPQAGDTLHLYLDADLQRTLRSALQQQIETLQATKPEGKGKEACAGAAVVVDVQTGGVLAAVSLPDYNLASWRQDYAALTAAETSPLVNRVLNGQYAPGSAFKPAVAASALAAGIITPQSTVNCGGRYTYYAGSQPRCLQMGHRGAVSMVTALRHSCNIYFYDVGRRLGVDTFSATAQQLGLGAPCGTELPETTGRLTWSTDENYQAGLALMAAIGQGNTAVTPLQLAAYAATLANCGQRPALHFADRAVNAATGETVWQYAPTFTTVPGGEGVFGPIRDGMKRMARTTRVLRGQDRQSPAGGHPARRRALCQLGTDRLCARGRPANCHGRRAGIRRWRVQRRAHPARCAGCRLWRMIAERRSTPIGCAWAFCRFSASKSFPYRDFLQKEHVTF